MFTTHGHHIDGTELVEEDRPKSVARCGGPGICDTCSRDAATAKMYNQGTEFPRRNNRELQFDTFVRRPFSVQAVEITYQNIRQVAELIGVLKHRDDRTPYIVVNKEIVPNIPTAYTGYWLTKMGENVRLYARKPFFEQFVESSVEVDQWAASINSAHPGS